MIFTVKPTESIKATIVLPASKSYSIRAFMIAACGGRSTIIRPSNCQDAMVAMQTAKALGASVVVEGDHYRVQASERMQKSRVIHVGESGTTLRFVLPLLPFYVEKATVKGKGTLIGRPNDHLNQALRAQGLSIKGAGRKESVPIVYQGGSLAGGAIPIDGTVSSQFISALLIAAAKLPHHSRITIQGDKVVSRDYITMTRQVLELTGIKTTHRSLRQLSVDGNQIFKGLKRFVVPSDYGLAAFFLVAAAITKSNITLKGYLNDAFVQADGAIFGLLKKMGVVFEKTLRSVRVQGPFNIKGGTFSLKDCPDLLPILAVLALFAQDKTTFVDIAHARVKESDRISDLRKELLKVGARLEEKQDSLTVFPLDDRVKSGVTLEAHHDHRLAMAFAVLGLRIGVRVKGMESCAKSYPDFMRDFSMLTT